MFLKVLIIGTGEHASEVLDNLTFQKNIKAVGLVSKSKKFLGKKFYGLKVVCTDSTIRNYIKKNKHINGYFIGLGTSNLIMEKRIEIIKKIPKELKTFNIIHPTAIVSNSSTIGKGNLIESFTKIGPNATIGSYCIIQSFVSINHDVHIEDNVMLATHVSFAGRKIGKNSIIGDGATITFKKNIGKNCYLCEGSVLTKNMPNNSFAYGSPAKIFDKNNQTLNILNKKINEG